MKNIFIAFVLLLISYDSKAQAYVTIPDPAFVSFLQSNYPGCMSGNQMDTTCASITNDTYLTIYGPAITDLTGIQYFDNLKYLGVTANISSLPVLPFKLKSLKIRGSSLTVVSISHDSIINLDLSDNNLLNSITTFPDHLERFTATHSPQLTYIVPFPVSTGYIAVAYCSWDTIPFSPLPVSLDTLLCPLNQLLTLPTLPVNLKYLSCEKNHLVNLPTLPNGLLTLNCSINLITNIPALPFPLLELYADFNHLSSLPSLPTGLHSLGCSYNLLTSLPVLPLSLKALGCNNNVLTSLPALPDTLLALFCDNNQISCFPTFPAAMDEAFIGGLGGLSISGNPFSCLPNYVALMDPYLLSYPLCGSDSLSNPNNCGVADMISGVTFRDINFNCLSDGIDSSLRNIHVLKYNSSGVLINQTYSLNNSYYTFTSNDTGVYRIQIDTLNMPYTYQCPFPGVDTNVNITSLNPAAMNVNFDLKCKPGVDVGIQSVLPLGIVFPGMTHSLRVLAGDLSRWYGLNCAAGTGGMVQISVSGPVTYSGITSGALTPITGSGMYTYNIADFGSVDNSTAFGLMFSTDTSAQAGDSICVSIVVTPVAGDINPDNNNYHMCYSVRNSYDPNIKETYPENVLPGYEDYFTYTIHFQNTGTAPAQRVVLLDRLDSNLVAETFQVINYSHNNSVSLKAPSWGWGKDLTVSFNDIMLADSASDPEGSKGFIQYRIKPRPNLQAGIQILNQASIFFDYNSYVNTNQTVNEFITVTSIAETDEKKRISVYPNPGTGIFNFNLRGGSRVEIYDIRGQLIYSILSQGNRQEIDLTGKSKGLYFYKVIAENGDLNQGKIIIQ